MIAEEFPAPGSRLPTEADLAERLQVSRIVIREAMKILEDRGILEIHAGRGTFTLAPSPDQVQESLLRLFRDRPVPTLADMESLLELRQVLEETSASLAAVRATPEDLVEIESALQEMANDTVDLDKIAAADLRFHRAVMRAAHNPFLEMIQDPIMATFLEQIKLTNTMNVGYDRHRLIFEEIRDRNQIGARQAVRRLMKATLQDARKALGNLRKG